MYALSCHALIADLPPSESSPILQAVEAMLSEKYRIGHTAIQFESHTHQANCCSMDGLYCQLEVADQHQHEHDHSHDAVHNHLHTSVGERDVREREGAH
jgi:cobalt-zinc-cadmium efflux system protein